MKKALLFMNHSTLFRTCFLTIIDYFSMASVPLWQMLKHRLKEIFPEFARHDLRARRPCPQVIDFADS